MVVEIDGVVKLVPVPKEEPPEEATYQFIVPALAIAARETVPVPHLEPGVVPVIASNEYTVTVNEQTVVPHEFVIVSVTVVIPLLNVEPLPVPLPLPVVAPLNVYVIAGGVGYVICTTPLPLLYPCV